MVQMEKEFITPQYAFQYTFKNKPGNTEIRRRNKERIK